MSEVTPEVRDQLVRKAYTAASARLRDAHKEEFISLQKEEAQKLGLDWQPRKSKAEKDREQINKLLTENPDLYAELVANIRATAETVSQ